jgi:hypothetical protein
MKRKLNSHGSQGNRKSKTSRLDVASLSQGPLNEEGDQTDYLCASCKQIDFASIIKTAESDLPRRVCRLGHIHSESKCSLCGFLRRMQPPKYVGSLHLIAVSAKSFFTIPKSVQINDCMLLSVSVNTLRHHYNKLNFFGIPQTGHQQLSVREISEYLP